MKNKKEGFYKLFWLFILGSIFGFVIEGIYSFLKYNKLINHTCVVIGPFNMIYGIGAVLLTVILFKRKNYGYGRLFISSFFIGSFIEYCISFLSEKIIGFTAWNYSRYFLNINGRICLIMSMIWGILGIIWIKLIYPAIKRIIDKMNTNFWNLLARILIIFLIFDGILTLTAINRAKDKGNGLIASNEFERFLDKSFNKQYLKNMFNDKWYK